MRTTHIPQLRTLIVVVALAGLFWSMQLSGSARRMTSAPLAANIVVNSTSDVAVGGDGLCTLREAITNANDNSQLPGSIAGDCAAGMAGLDNITFNLGAGPYTITVIGSDLPNIIEPVNLNGSTGNAAFPRVELNGGGARADGLHLEAGPVSSPGGSTITSFVINGFRDDGIQIQDANGTTVRNSYLGISAAGGAGPGLGFGIFVTDSSNVTIGGTTAADRNVIGNIRTDGILISNAPGAVITGNFIGTDATGLVALGIGDDAIDLNGANSTIVGGTTGTTPGACTGACNVIGSAGDAGIEIFNNIMNAVVQGNYIGLNANGTAVIGNNGQGIDITTGSVDNNLIGGTAPGAGNIITGSGSTGVRVVDGATGNAILGNAIYNNNPLGIDLNGGGVTPNDPQDPDIGGNNLQNFPVLNCVLSGSASFIGGTLNSLPNSNFRIEFFANAACDPSGNGEGQRYLGFQNVTTDANGDAVIAAGVAASVAAGEVVTATATLLDAMNNPVETSEFSACFAGPFFFPTVTINDVVLAEGNAGTTNFVFTVTLTNVQGACGPVTVNYATANGTATGPTDFTPTSGALVFNPPFATNTVTQQIIVPVVGDLIVEGDETFFVNIAPIGATATDAQGQGTIINDDFATIAINDVSQTEGNTGTSTFTFTVTLSQPSSEQVTVNFTTANGTAIAPGDYLATAGTLTFAPGVTAQTINVTVNGDLAFESDETFFVNLSGIAGNNAAVPDPTFADAQGQGTIRNDDTPLGPGVSFPEEAEVSDQKAGSVLVYNLYSSSAASPNTQNTRLSITNVNPTFDIAVHLFFVDGQTCSIADAIICLTKNQTASFLASDLDPGTTGYLVAVASDLATGCPVNFNFLIGDEYVKLSTGHQANLGAEAFAALAGATVACDGNSLTAQLNFDGVSYNRAPRTVAASSIPARNDGNDTLLVVNRFGGNLATGASTLTDLLGLFYDDAENGLSFTFSPGTCQFRSSLSGSFPRTTPRLDSFIPAGRTGWLRLYSVSDLGLLGAVLNYNPNAGTSAGAFNQGRNLHKLTLTSTQTLVIPIFPPNCLD